MVASVSAPLNTPHTPIVDASLLSAFSSEVFKSPGGLLCAVAVFRIAMRRWVPLGGWCGPSLMLAKLGVRPMEEALPFDMVRCTMDGIILFTRDGFASGYFPGSLDARPFPYDPVSIWLLFRSQHSCFTHFDLNAPMAAEELLRRIDNWEVLLAPDPSSAMKSLTPDWVLDRRPITFLRTTIAENPQEEIALLPAFHDALKEKTKGKLPFRTVMVVHDQASTTKPLCSVGDEESACVVWNLRRDRRLPSEVPQAEDGKPSKHEQRSLLDECHDGYQTIITTMSKEQEWQSLSRELPTFHTYVPEQGKWHPYRDLCRAEGLPVVRGSCTGIGSTHGKDACPFCGSTDGHSIAKDIFDRMETWTEDQETNLLMAYAMNNGDKVAAVETIALAQSRGANETLIKLHQLLGMDEEMMSGSST